MNSNPSIPFHVPSLGEQEAKAVLEVLRSGWLTTGAQVHEFQEEFAAYIGCRHAIALNSATAALHLALDAIGLKAGEEVIVPTMTFAATAEVVQYFGAVPVLVDCERSTYNISAQECERAITPKTRAVIPVHFAGQSCDMDRIHEIAAAHNIHVIEDAAHALPTTYRGRRIGTLSEMTCFSFYATKNITTGEGGMLVTDNQEYADRARMMSLHGISRDAWKRYTAQGSWYYEILEPGFKYNLTDIAAALGRVQLQRCDEFHAAREKIAARYTEAFASCPEITPLAVEDPGAHAWHLFVVEIDTNRLRINRAQIMDELKQSGIGASVHFIPLHLHPHYRGRFGYTPESCPEASAASERNLSLPLFPSLSVDDSERVANCLIDIVAKHRR